VVKLGVGQASRVVGEGKLEERLLAPCELKEGRSHALSIP
jgi:hypothetical protein